MSSTIRTLSCSALVCAIFLFSGNSAAQSAQIQKSRFTTSVAYSNGPTEPDPDGGDVVKSIGHSLKPRMSTSDASSNGPTEPDPDGGDVVEAFKLWLRALWLSNQG